MYRHILLITAAALFALPAWADESPSPSPSASPLPSLSPSPSVSPSPSPSSSPSPSPSPASQNTAGTQVDVVTNQNVIVVGNQDDAAVSFYITDDRAQTQPGQILTYRLVINNPFEEDLEQLKITSHVPPFLLPIATTPEATLNSSARTITWTHQNISANSEVTLAFKARVAPNTPEDYELLVSADVNGPGIRLSDADETKVLTPGYAVTEQAAHDQASAVAAATTILPVSPTASTGGLQPLLAAIGTATLTGAAVARKGIARFLPR